MWTSQRPAVGSSDWLDLYDAFLSAVKASELSVTSDVECDGDPGRDARKQYLSSGMPWPKSLNEQPATTRWTAEAEGKRDSDAVTNDENGKRYSNEPRPAEDQDSNHAREK